MRNKKRTSQGQQSLGFTLVEMLVAVALVLLMMSLFAQVFQLAGGTITTQRGIAENDQRSRTFQNVIKADLDKRTFRVVMPWSVGEDGALAEVDAIKREGYFYISENDPLNDLDDHFQFTMNVNAIAKNNDLSSFFGKATTSGSWTNTDTSQTPNVTYLNFSNQPEADDGWTIPNGTAEASAAEVSYFVRGGKLYRRTLLIRKALPVGTRTDGQPTFNDSRDAFNVTPLDPAWPTPNPQPYGGINHSTYTNHTFWNDFDHSAFMYDDPNNGTLPKYQNVPIPPQAIFHSLEDLGNASTQTQFPLGNPRYRFGHRTDNGRSREFDAPDVSNVVRYFGRFMHEETSHFDFRYPHNVSTIGNPMTADITLDVDPSTSPLTDNTFPDFAFGSRRGEDLLLSNVHGFDVKVWDSGALGGAGAFVDIGRTPADADVYNPAAVDFALANRSNTAHGPINTVSPFAVPYNVNRVFDTWHPTPGIDIDGSTGDDTPPFRHVIYGAAANSGAYGYAVGQAPNFLVKQKPVWDETTTYNEGDLVFPTQDVGPPDPPVDNQRPNGLRFVYRCIRVEGAPGPEPEPTLQQWPAVAGGRVQIPDTSTTDYYVFEAVDNWRPLRAIQITVRFYDVTSEQMRQQTIVHSLVD